MRENRFFTVVAVLALTAVVSLLGYMPARFETGRGVRIAEFPRAFSGWNSVDLPLEPEVYALLETDNLIMRNYTNPQGEVVNLYIIYSDNNRKVAHPPELCLQGAGASIEGKSEIRLTDQISATQLVLGNGDAKELGLYWYKAGKLYTGSYIRQQFDIAVKTLFRQPASIAMIRLLAPVKQSPEKTLQLLQSFAREIQPLLDRYAP